MHCIHISTFCKELEDFFPVEIALNLLDKTPY
jgi:hypothetical protein